MLHQDAPHTGLLITPWPLTVAVIAPLAGRLEREPILLVPFLMICGAGFRLFQVSNNRNMFSRRLPSPAAQRAACRERRDSPDRRWAILMTLLFSLTTLELAPRIGLLVAAALTLGAGGISTLRERGDGKRKAPKLL